MKEIRLINGTQEEKFVYLSAVVEGRAQWRVLVLDVLNLKRIICNYYTNKRDVKTNLSYPLSFCG